MKITSPCVKAAFLSGLPHIGKTTAVERIVAASPLPTYGFITHGVMQDGHRVALDIVSHRQLRYRVASRTPATKKFIGHFALDHDTFERALDDTFGGVPDDGLIYIDEIGGLYCQSDRFVNDVMVFLKKYRMIGSIQTKGHPLAGRIVQTPHAKIWNVTGTNRDDVPMEIIREFFPESNV